MTTYYCDVTSPYLLVTTLTSEVSFLSCNFFHYISREAWRIRNVYWPWPSLCLCVCLSVDAFPDYCTDPDVTWGNGRRCPLVVHYWRICNQCTDFVAMTTYTYVSLKPYTLQMRIAWNAKCQRVLVSYSTYDSFFICRSIDVWYTASDR